MKKLILSIIVLMLFAAGCSAREASTVAAEMPAPTVKPTPAATPEPTPVPAYTFAWMSDTQHYSERFHDTFSAMTEYLRDNREELNLKFIVHTGDIVGSAGRESSWAAAEAALANISDIPAGICAGNHDVHGSRAQYEHYWKHFGREQWGFRPCYGEDFQNNRCHYDLIEAGNTEYLFLFLGYKVTDKAVEWAKGVLDSFPDRVVIICTHAYFDTNLSYLEDGHTIHDELVAKYPNVYLVLGGHRYNVACVPEDFDDDGDGAPDRTVYQMICNYQAANEFGGSGYMMLLRIDEAAGKIRAVTYSPVLKDYVYFDDNSRPKGRYRNAPEDERFIIDIPWEIAVD